MLICVRTTLLLPDDLYREVKATAAADDRTVTSFVEEALREALARHATPPTREPYRIEAFGSGGVLPGVDLTDSAALLDVLEAR
jgi:hypothetical protein